jgi:hypothetical protein
MEADMPQICHKHCPPERGHGALLIAAGVIIGVLALAVIAAARWARAHETMLALGLIATIAAGWTGYAAAGVVRARGSQARNRQTISRHAPDVPGAPEGVQRRATEAPPDAPAPHLR